MGQITSGIRAALSLPVVYDTYQTLMGARQVRQDMADNFIRARAGDRVLDVGCGTGQLIEFLPRVDYHGFDISAEYIDFARRQFAGRGEFHDRLLTPDALAELGTFDIVIGFGLLHHLDDGEAADLFGMVRSALRPGGRLVTIDPCFVPRQSPIARYLAARDRGRNVRTADGYRRLAEAAFPQVSTSIRHRRWILFTHFIMTCTGPAPAAGASTP